MSNKNNPAGPIVDLIQRLNLDVGVVEDLYGNVFNPASETSVTRTNGFWFFRIDTPRVLSLGEVFEKAAEDNAEAGIIPVRNDSFDLRAISGNENTLVLSASLESARARRVSVTVDVPGADIVIYNAHQKIAEGRGTASAGLLLSSPRHGNIIGQLLGNNEINIIIRKVQGDFFDGEVTVDAPQNFNLRSPALDQVAWEDSEILFDVDSIKLGWGDSPFVGSWDLERTTYQKLGNVNSVTTVNNGFTFNVEGTHDPDTSVVIKDEIIGKVTDYTQNASDTDITVETSLTNTGNWTGKDMYEFFDTKVISNIERSTVLDEGAIIRYIDEVSISGPYTYRIAPRGALNDTRGPWSDTQTVFTPGSDLFVEIQDNRKILVDLYQNEANLDTDFFVGPETESIEITYIDENDTVQERYNLNVTPNSVFTHTLQDAALDAIDPSGSNKIIPLLFAFGPPGPRIEAVPYDAADGAQGTGNAGPVDKRPVNDREEDSTIESPSQEGELLISTADPVWDAADYLIQRTEPTNQSFLTHPGTGGGAGQTATWGTVQDLTRVNDTNVTLTLGGTPTGSLLNAVTMTLGWTGVLAETRGGTGLGTYATGDILYSNALNSLTSLGIGATNAVLTSDGSIPGWTAGLTNVHIASGAEIEVSKLADGTARQLLQTDAVGTGVEWASNIDIPGTLDVTSATTLDSTLDVVGAATLQNTLDVTGISTFNSIIDMNTNRVTDMGDPVNPQDAVTLSYLSDQTSQKTHFADLWNNLLVSGGNVVLGHLDGTNDFVEGRDGSNNYTAVALETGGIVYIDGRRSSLDYAVNYPNTRSGEYTTADRPSTVIDFTDLDAGAPPPTHTFYIYIVGSFIPSGSVERQAWVELYDGSIVPDHNVAVARVTWDGTSVEWDDVQQARELDQYTLASEDQHDPYTARLFAHAVGAEGEVDSATSGGLTDSSRDWETDEWKDEYVRVDFAAGGTETKQITSNSASTLSISGTWSTTPSDGDTYTIGVNSSGTSGTAFQRRVAYLANRTNFWAASAGKDLGGDPSNSKHNYYRWGKLWLDDEVDIDTGVRQAFFSASAVGTSSSHSYDIRTAGLNRISITSGGNVSVVNDLNVLGTLSKSGTSVSLVGHTHAAGDVDSGTFADARIAQSNVTQHQAALSLGASQITSGTFADARIAQTNVTQHESALSIGASQVSAGTLSGLFTFSSTLTIENAEPILVFSETDQTLPAGLYRIRGNNDQLIFERNTAAAGDFSTVQSSFNIENTGQVIFNSTPKVGAALVSVEGHNHNDLYYTESESDSRYPQVSNANTWSGLQTFSAGIAITGGSAAAGRIWEDSNDGINMQAVSGTTNDFILISAAGTGTVFRVPTGTSKPDFPSGFTTTSSTVVTNLNADLLDGNHASAFADASHNHNHDSLNGFVANEHIDHSTVSITAGTALTGGGTIAASRTLNVDETALTIAASQLTGGTMSGSYTVTSTLTANGQFRHLNDGQPAEMPRGIDGGYGDSQGTGTNWGANIWSIGDSWAGTGSGTGFSIGSYGLEWLRAGHASADASIGEGLYIYQGGNQRGGIGSVGAKFNVTLTVNGVNGLVAGDIPNLAASKITSGTFANARISQSSVTQHEGAINHDALTNFVANEHIDHSSVSITAGTGLTGGGTIAASRTLNVSITAANVPVGTFPSSSGTYVFNTHTRWNDNDRIRVGSGSDLDIFHDGNSWLENDGGILYIRQRVHGSTVRIQAENGAGTTTNNCAIFGGTNPYVRLYYNSNLRFETDSAGVDVTGRVDATGNFYDGSSIQLKNVEKRWDGDALDIIRNTELWQYTYKADPDEKLKIGFIAEEAHPYYVDISRKYGDLHNVIALNLAGIQQMDLQLEDHEDRIAELEEENERLRAKVSQLEA